MKIPVEEFMLCIGLCAVFVIGFIIYLIIAGAKED